MSLPQLSGPSLHSVSVSGRLRDSTNNAQSQQMGQRRGSATGSIQDTGPACWVLGPPRSLHGQPSGDGRDP